MNYGIEFNASVVNHDGQWSAGTHITTSDGHDISAESQADNAFDLYDDMINQLDNALLELQQREEKSPEELLEDKIKSLETNNEMLERRVRDLIAENDKLKTQQVKDDKKKNNVNELEKAWEELFNIWNKN